MTNTLIEWLINLIYEFMQFGSWLVTPLPYVNMTPLAMFGFAGLTAIIVILLVRLFVGG